MPSRGDVGTTRRRADFSSTKITAYAFGAVWLLRENCILVRRIKRAESWVENLPKTDGGIAVEREHLAARTEFLRGPANSDNQFTIDPCSFSGHVILLWRGSFTVPRNYGVRRYYAESSLKLYHSTVNNLKGARMGASSFIKGVIDLIFSQFHVGW